MQIVNAKLLALAGTLVIAATTVSAQVNSVALKAAVPFSFQAGSGHMLPAGNYRIRHNGPTWNFSNTETREETIALPSSAVQDKMTDTANLVFECRANGSSCTLRSIHAGNGQEGANWRAPKRSKSDGEELARMVVVPVSFAAE